MSRVGYNLAMISANTRGVHVLLIDSDLLSLASTARMLEYLSYKVTVTQNGRAALSILSDSANRINLVLTDVQLPDVNGFIILTEAVKKDIPIIMMSKNEDSMVMKMALHHGASFFIHKPLSSLMAKDLWQFVLRAKLVLPRMVAMRNFCADKDNYEGDSDSSETVSLDISERNPKRPRNKMQRISTAWTEELHAKFVNAVIQLGDGYCYPKEILETMNVPGLTRMQVASHLQKCRDGMWLGPEDYRPFIREARVSNPGRLYSLRKFGAMPLSVKLQLRNEIRNGTRVAGPELRLGLGLPDTGSSSKEVGSDTPSSSSSNGNSVGLEFYKIMAKLGRAHGSLKLRSPKMEPANP